MIKNLVEWQGTDILILLINERRQVTSWWQKVSDSCSPMALFFFCQTTFNLLYFLLKYFCEATTFSLITFPVLNCSNIEKRVMRCAIKMSKAHAQLLWHGRKRTTDSNKTELAKTIYDCCSAWWERFMIGRITFDFFLARLCKLGA